MGNGQVKQLCRILAHRRVVVSKILVFGFHSILKV